MRTIAAIGSIGIGIFGGWFTMGILVHTIGWVVVLLTFAAPIPLNGSILLSLQYSISHAVPSIPIVLPFVGLVVSIVLQSVGLKKAKNIKNPL